MVNPQARYWHLSLSARVCTLWQVENCTFGDVPFSLPGTLRILSLKCEQVPLESQLSTLLRDCHSLEVRS